jgi:hypothetical protein
VSVVHLEQCYINGSFYEPNGTGPSELFNSAKYAKWLRAFLKWRPSDRFQKVASHFHDIFYKIGGTKKDRAIADSKMKKIAIREVDAVYRWYNPKRYIYNNLMRINWIFVKLNGEDSFNFTHPDSKPRIQSVKDYEMLVEYNRLKAKGLVK